MYVSLPGGGTAPGTGVDSGAAVKAPGTKGFRNVVVWEKAADASVNNSPPVNAEILRKLVTRLARLTMVLVVSTKERLVRLH
jgi:hypothetical protein